MADRIKNIVARIKDFWNRYTSKQKTLIICIAGAIIFAFVLLSFILSRPTYIQLARLDDDKAATKMIDSLDGEGITYKASSEGNFTIIKVDKKDYTNASLLIGSNDNFTSAMTYEDAFNNDMSTTTTEKNLKVTLALQNSLAEGFKQFEGIMDAEVYINRPEKEYTVLSENKDATVSIVLDLDENKPLQSAAPKSMALLAANAVGNSNTDSIMITDLKGNLLFGGKSSGALGGEINDVAEYKQKLQNQIAENVNLLLLKCDFDDVQIGSANIKLNMDKVTELYTEYSVAEGQEQGYLDNTYNYESTGNSASGGIPGTDSNDDETDTMIQDSGSSNTSTKLDKAKYLPNSLVRNIEKEQGAVVPDESSMALVLTQYQKITQESLEEQGLLKDVTFDEYVNQNSAKTVAQVEDDIKTLVADTTGISESNISIVAYTQPVYQAKEKGKTVSASNIIMIVLVVLIVGLLVFVIIKSTAPMSIAEMEPELSVEELLATTKENQSLDDIEFSDKSETRKMIEKFVDENPEAVASLLRNWLNDEWGM